MKSSSQLLSLQLTSLDVEMLFDNTAALVLALRNASSLRSLSIAVSGTFLFYPQEALAPLFATRYPLLEKFSFAVHNELMSHTSLAEFVRAHASTLTELSLSDYLGAYLLPFADSYCRLFVLLYIPL